MGTNIATPDATQDSEFCVVVGINSHDPHIELGFYTLTIVTCRQDMLGVMLGMQDADLITNGFINVTSTEAAAIEDALPEKISLANIPVSFRTPASDETVEESNVISDQMEISNMVMQIVDPILE